MEWGQIERREFPAQNVFFITEKCTFNVTTRRIWWSDLVCRLATVSCSYLQIRSQQKSNFGEFMNQTKRRFQKINSMYSMIICRYSVVRLTGLNSKTTALIKWRGIAWKASGAQLLSTFLNKTIKHIQVHLITNAWSSLLQKIVFNWGST